jgi:hypothetical protein
MGRTGRINPAYCFHASCDFRERASVGCHGSTNCLVVDELSFAPADDEFGLAENLEMMRRAQGLQMRM